MNATADRRLAAGVCPQCGRDAAPFRLCARCRLGGQVRRLFRRAEKEGLLENIGTDRRPRWRKVKDAPSLEDSLTHWTHGYAFDEAAEGNDKRFRPRLRGVPVDVLEQTLEIIRAQGGQATESEICAAWGRLRSKPDRKSSAQDIVRIMAADAKRARRLAKRSKA